MAKHNLVFTHKLKKPLSETSKAKMIELDEQIRKHANYKKYGFHIKGRVLANALDLSMSDLRKLIQLRREHNDEILPDWFIVADPSGYTLTNDKKLIRDWANQKHIVATSALAQVDQCWKITKRSW